MTVENIVAWWEACRFALHMLKQQGLIGGAFTFETISVHRYWPNAMALPHVHVVLLADNITPDTIGDLKRLMASYHGQTWQSKTKRWIEPEAPEPIWAKASTRTFPIRRDYDFASVLSYLCNPVNLATAYIRDWPLVAGNRWERCQFNENVVEAINAWCAALIGRWGHRYLGALQHAHRDFTGVKLAVRESPQHRRMVKDLLSECQLKRLAELNPDDLGTPVEFEADF